MTEETMTEETMTEETMTEPTLHQVTTTICSACLDGLGEECHSPGCVFIWHDTPAKESRGCTLRTLLMGVGSIDGVVTYPPPLCCACGKSATHIKNGNGARNIYTCQEHSEVAVA